MPDESRLTAQEPEHERQEHELREAAQAQSDAEQQGVEDEQPTPGIDKDLSERARVTSVSEWSGAPASSTARAAHDRSRVGRDTNTGERRRTTLARTRNTASRVETAARRDRVARLRDKASDKRDRIAQARDDAADARDQAAEARERRAGDELSIELLRDLHDLREQGAALRHQSALDRLQAASDREAAAGDRRLAARERRLTTTDGLTGSLRRNAGETALALELARARRGHCDIAILIIDVDGLRIVNETYGQIAGDAVLRDVVAAISASHQPHDLVARWGDDELLLAMPETTAEQALRRLAAIQLAFAERTAAASISAGHTQMQHDDTVDSLLTRAHAALHDAKRSREP